MKKLGLALCLLITLAACTITKRQHLGGWHVEWKHHHKTDRGSEVTDRFESDNQLVNASIAESQPLADSIISPLNDGAIALQTVAESVQKPVVKEQLQQVSFREVYRKDNPNNLLSSALRSKKLTGKLFSVKPNTEETQDLTGLVIVLLTLGVLMILASIYFLFLEVLAAAAFGTPYLGISALLFVAGLLMILVGIVIGAKNSSDRKDDFAREKEERVKREKAKTQEEKDEAMWAQYKRAVRASIIIAVLFFAVGLFALAIGEAIPIIPIMALFFGICILLVWMRYRQKIREAEGTMEGAKS